MWALSKTMFYETWKGTPHMESVAVGGQAWKTQQHTYDLAGNYTDFKDAENGQHQWPVDENNRPTEIRYQNQTSRSISYTPGGQIDQETLRDASGAAIATTTHTYDTAGQRISSQTAQAGTGEVLTHYGWEYDSRHLIRAIHLNHLGVDVTLGLDGRGRPATESTPGNNGSSPGRDHATKSGPKQKAATGARLHKKAEDAKAEAAKAWNEWDDMSDELRKLLGEKGMPKMPRPRE